MVTAITVITMIYDASTRWLTVVGFTSWYCRDSLLTHRRLGMGQNCGMQTESPKTNGGNTSEYPLVNSVFLFTIG